MANRKISRELDAFLRELTELRARHLIGVKHYFHQWTAEERDEFWHECIGHQLYYRFALYIDDPSIEVKPRWTSGMKDIIENSPLKEVIYFDPVSSSMLFLDHISETEKTYIQSIVLDAKNTIL